MKYESLTKYINVFNDGYKAGELINHRNNGPIIIMPFIEYKKEVNEFAREVEFVGDNKYKITLKVGGINLSKNDIVDLDISKMNIKTIIAILFNIIKNERVNEGILKYAIETGFVTRCLNRIKELDK